MTDNVAGRPGPEELRAVDAVRGRLLATVQFLEKLRFDLNRQGLMDRSALANRQINAQAFLSRLRTSLHEHREPLSSLQPYPSPSFQITSNPAFPPITETLLRKKLEPKIEDWVIERLKAAAEFCDGVEDWIDVPAAARARREGTALLDEGHEEHVADVMQGIEDSSGNSAFEPLKILHGTLNEEEITAVWDSLLSWWNALFGDQGQESSEDESDEEAESHAKEEADGPTITEQISGVDVKKENEPVMQPLPLGVGLKFGVTGVPTGITG